MPQLRNRKVQVTGTWMVMPRCHLQTELKTAPVTILITIVTVVASVLEISNHLPRLKVASNHVLPFRAVANHL